MGRAKTDSKASKAKISFSISLWETSAKVERRLDQVRERRQRRLMESFHNSPRCLPSGSKASGTGRRRELFK